MDLCLAPILSIQADSLSGNVVDDGTQTGSVHVSTWHPQTGNKSLKLDGAGDFVNVGAVDLSGSALSIEYYFRGSSIQSAVRQQSGGWIVAGWSGLHILSNDGGVSGISAGANATDERWHHVVLTWEQGAADGFRSYLDGELVDSRDASNDPIPDHAADLFLGSIGGTGEFANGELDEVAV